MPEWDDTQWRNSAFCLLCPDCLRRQLAAAVLGKLRDAGYVPGGWRPVRVGGKQVDGVAEIQGVGAGKAFHYRALDSLFGLGESIAIRLDDTRGRGPDEFYHQLSTLKGSTPEKSRPGSIRYDLGSVNAVMSLLHISDSPGNSARESVAILGPDAVLLDPSHLGTYLELLASTQCREERDFEDVLTAVRGRLVAVMWQDLSDRGRQVAAGLAAAGELAQPKAGVQIAAELTAANPLAAVLARSFTPADGPAEIGEVPLLLQLHGQALDPWEQAVLATSCYFEPVRPTAGAA
jgi:nucleoside diphosphate kinase